MVVVALFDLCLCRHKHKDKGGRLLLLMRYLRTLALILISRLRLMQTNGCNELFLHSSTRKQLHC